MIPVDDINDVRWFQIPANTLPTHQEMRLIMEMVEKIASIGSYQSGQESNIVKTRATARGTMAIIQQGERRFFVLGMTLQSHLADLMKDRLRYYQQYLSPQMAERILGKDGELLFPQGVDKAKLAGEYDLRMSLDATGGSKSQKVEISSMVYQNYLPNPFVQQDPSRLWEVSAGPLKDIGLPNVEEILGPKPVPKTPEQIAQEQQMAQQMAMMQAAGGGPSASAPPPGAAPSESQASPPPQQ